MADDPKINQDLDSLRENVANLHTKMDHLNRILSESFITLKIIEQHDGKIDQCIRLLNKLTNKVPINMFFYKVYKFRIFHKVFQICVRK